jgi:hypothetical protein
MPVEEEDPRTGTARMEKRKPEVARLIKSPIAADLMNFL